MRGRDLITRVRARIARYREEVVPGTEIARTIDIDRLMCPLRYDLWVRIEFIRLLRDEWSLYAKDLPGFLDRPQSRAYHVWFKEVRCAIYSPRIYRDEALLKLEFARRVHETATLWKSIERNGYDRSTPIRLGSGRSIRPVNGKKINSAYFAGDGCHRMSCLYVTGQTQLQPEDYEVQIRPEFEPLDITAILLHRLPLARTAYLHFLSRFYCEGLQLDTAEQILQHVGSAKPDLLAELESALAFDLPRTLRP
ncbi:MAG: hypothetical protein QOH59_2780 [Gemmatimonadales bacterium]|jgi:hypothetical protein|nr:hypothetical protein [Gemmatimonadales bacterium]